MNVLIFKDFYPETENVSYHLNIFITQNQNSEYNPHAKRSSDIILVIRFVTDLTQKYVGCVRSVTKLITVVRC